MQEKFYVRLFAILTDRIISESILQLGYKKFTSNEGPQRYHKCITEIAENEAKRLSLETNGEEIFNVPTVIIKTYYYQKLISFIFSRPQIRRSIISAEYFNKPIVFPLKHDWIEIFEKNGFQFEKKISISLWKLLSMFSILRQLAHFMYFFFSNQRLGYSNKHSRSHNNNKKIFFHDFPPGSLLSKNKI
jgi:hypothetical protein